MDQIVDRLADPADVDAAIEDLAAAFGNRLVTSRVVREQHGNTTTWIALEPPDAVVYPQSSEDVQQVVASAPGTACRSFRSAPGRPSKAASTRPSAASRSTSRI